MTSEPRDGLLTIRIGKTETDMLLALAERDGLTKSDWLRMTIRQRYLDTFGSSTPGSSKPAKAGRKKGT